MVHADPHVQTEAFIVKWVMSAPGCSTGRLNAMGSGEWTVEAAVTHVCYSDYRCVGNLPEEPLCGAAITGNYS